MADPGSLVKVANNSRGLCTTRSKAGRLGSTSGVEGEGAGRGGKVKDIPLNKFIWMRKTLMMIIVMFQRSHYLRRGRDSLDEEGGRLGPRDSAGLEKVILIILK